MKKILHFITDKPLKVVLTYLVIVCFCAAIIPLVNVEYDLSAYLPKNTASYQGKQLLEEQFQMGGQASLMIKEDSPQKASKLAMELQSIEGVKESLYFPTNTKDGYSLINLVFSKSSTNKQTQQAIDNIINTVGDIEHYLGGESAIAKDIQETTGKEVIIYSIIAFIIIFIILLLSSKTIIEPVYFFIAIGVAIVINMGTNLVFGSISSNTNAVASILQLAVSMDYSIFLLHRYHEEKRFAPPAQAMRSAITKSFQSISASALTTVGGFIALASMKFGIGKDMGFVLAKGVILSLVCVITFLPALILLIDKKVSLKEHKIFIPSFNKLSTGFVKIRYVALIGAVICAIPLFISHSKVEYYYSNEKTLKDSAKSVVATNKISETFGTSNQIVVITPIEQQVKTKSTMDKINSLESVSQTAGLYSFIDSQTPPELIPSEIKSKFQNENYGYFAINLATAIEGNETSKSISDIKTILNEDFGESYYITGEAVVYDDLKIVTSTDFNIVTLVSIALVGLVLLFAFKSITLPLILIFIIQLGIWINLSIPYFMGEPLNFISFIILGAIQLGATVDYAILFTSRYKENLLSQTPRNAIKLTMSETSQSVLTSALILITATLSVYFITTIRSASELTLLIARGSFISIILVYILLPALLLIFNKVISKTTLGWPKDISKNNK